MLDSFFESISKLVEKNDTILLFEEKFNLMKPFFKSLKFNDVKIREEFLRWDVCKYSDCKVPEHIKHICSSLVKDKELDPVENVEEKIEWLNNIPQPEQRTPEWYTYRNNVLTASALSDSFEKKESEKYNKLFKEKVLQKNEFIKGKALEHGIRNEQNAQSIYEMLTQTKVGEYGCIRHPTIDYLGASPDGIVISAENEKYIGRMLEIKCLFSRILTGIPLWKYWVQCQVQMEVCNLPYCDFLECIIDENIDEEMFYEKIEKEEFNDKFYGIVIQYEEKIDEENVKTNYLYSSLGESASFLKEWFDKETTQFEESEEKWFIKAFYWKLRKHSLITIERDKEWFKMISPKLEEFWNNVLTTRESIKRRPELAESMFKKAPKRQKKIEIQPVCNPDMCLIEDD